MKKTMVLMFFATMLMLPTLSFSTSIESIPLDSESAGIKIYTLDDTLPKGYDSISLISATGKFFDSIMQKITEETKKLNGNAVIILSMQKDGYHFMVFGKVIKTK